MRASYDCSVGNNALRIVETKHKIKVINVKERRRRRIIWRNVMVSTVMVALLVMCCYSIIKKSNERLFVDQQIDTLNRQIEVLEKEKQDLLSQSDTDKMEYGRIYKIAKDKLGMRFPTDNQVYYYYCKQGTMIRGQ